MSAVDGPALRLDPARHDRGGVSFTATRPDVLSQQIAANWLPIADVYFDTNARALVRDEHGTQAAAIWTGSMWGYGDAPQQQLEFEPIAFDDRRTSQHHWRPRREGEAIQGRPEQTACLLCAATRFEQSRSFRPEVPVCTNCESRGRDLAWKLGGARPHGLSGYSCADRPYIAERTLGLIEIMGRGSHQQLETVEELVESAGPMRARDWCERHGATFDDDVPF